MVSKVQASDPGDWKNTVTGVGLGNKLYTYERGGRLYSTSARFGSWKLLGEGYHTRFLLADGSSEGSLFAIEKNGNLYEVDPHTGDWEQVGEDGEWSDTVAADAVSGVLYTVETDGRLYKTDLNEETSEVIGEDFDTRALWAWQDHVYVLENSGTLYKVDPETSEFTQFGADGAYSDTQTATIHNGVLYAVEDDGALGATDIDDGGYEELDDEDLSDVRQLFSANGNLWAVENDGTLYRIDV